MLFLFCFRQQEVPRFIGVPKISKEDGGKLIVFEISCESKEQPEVYWSHNSKIIKNEGRYFSEIIKTQSLYRMVLELDDVQAADAGIYKVVAKNQSGYSEISIDFKQDDDEKKKKVEEKKTAAKPKDAEPETKGKNDQNKPAVSPASKAAPASFKEKPKDQVCCVFFLNFKNLKFLY
jgi:hypothetical protein